MSLLRKGDDYIGERMECRVFHLNRLSQAVFICCRFQPNTDAGLATLVPESTCTTVRDLDHNDPAGDLEDLLQVGDERGQIKFGTYK